MAKQVIDNIEIEASSGNVFADLGMPDAETRQIKSGLVIEIGLAMQRLGLTPAQASTRMGIPQSTLRDLMRGRFAAFSEQQLMDFLKRLDQATSSAS